MSAIGIETFPLGPLGTNSYLVHRDGEALAIDVGGDPAPVTAFLQAKGLKLLAILVTHQHFDHLYGVHALQEATASHPVSLIISSQLLMSFTSPFPMTGISTASFTCLITSLSAFPS